MGYYVSIDESTAVLPAKHLQEAHERMCALNFDNSKKIGGSYPRDENIPNDVPHDHVWYSWMEWNYHETCKDAKAILEMLGFECEHMADGSICIEYYNSKMGAEDEFLRSIGDLLEGYIEWRGEDGDRWKFEFGPEGMLIKTAKIVWV